VEPFPFVIACSRSGTTLLRAMLDSHPDLAIPPESHFLKAFLREPLTPEGFLSLLAMHPRFGKWELPIEEVSAAFAANGVSDASSAIRTLYATYAKRRGKPRWGDKTPEYVRFARGLGKLLPEARFIHLIRDGRDVALSWMQTPFSPGSIGQTAERWRRQVRRGRNAGNHLPGRYLEIKYERLVAEPEPVVREICAFIDLPFDPVMLDHTSRADEIIASAWNPAVHRRVRQPATPGLRNWRREMDADDVRCFEAVAGELLVELGYERTT
jgi:hypothetical protein